MSIQKEFIILLIAAVPDIENFSVWLKFSEKKEQIEETDFSDKIGYSEDVIQAMAISNGVSVDEQKKILIEKIRKNKIKELEKKYNFTSEDEEDEEEKSELMNKYRNYGEQLTKIPIRDMIYKNPLKPKDNG